MEDFEKIYLDTSKKLFLYLLNLCKNKELAEELTEETFYQAYMHLDSFKGESSVYTWLCKIGKNAFLKEQKRLKRHKDLKEDEIDNTDYLLFVEDKSMLQQIYRILNEMSDLKKEVFILHTMAGLSFKDLAALYGKTQSWAKMTYYRVKAEIAERIDKNE